LSSSCGMQWNWRESCREAALSPQAQPAPPSSRLSASQSPRGLASSPGEGESWAELPSGAMGLLLRKSGSRIIVAGVS